MTFQIARACESIPGWRGWRILPLLLNVHASLPAIPRGASQDSHTSLPSGYLVSTMFKLVFIMRASQRHTALFL